MSMESAQFAFDVLVIFFLGFFTVKSYFDDKKIKGIMERIQTLEIAEGVATSQSYHGVPNMTRMTWEKKKKTRIQRLRIFWFEVKNEIRRISEIIAKWCRKG